MTESKRWAGLVMEPEVDRGLAGSPQSSQDEETAIWREELQRQVEEVCRGR